MGYELCERTARQVAILDPLYEAKTLVEPMLIYNYKSRHQSNPGGWYAFYTWDYRFNQLWEDPDKFLRTGAIMFVEPNFSIDPSYKYPEVLIRIFQRREIARYWQSHKKLAIVDLHVPLNIMGMLDDEVTPSGPLILDGVPHGWSHYAIHGQADDDDRLTYAYQIASERAGKELTGPEFVVYASAKSSTAWAERHRCVCIPFVYVRQDQYLANETLPNGRQTRTWKSLPGMTCPKCGHTWNNDSES